MNFILGLGLSLGIAFMLTYLTFPTMEIFLVFVVITSGLCVISDIFPDWVISLDIIIMSIIIYQRWTK